MKTIKFCFVFVIFAFFLGNCQDNSAANDANDQSVENFFSVFENKEYEIREFLTKNSSKISKSNFFRNSDNFQTLKKNILLQKRKIEKLESKAKTYKEKQQSANSSNTTTIVKMDNAIIFDEISEEEIKNISLARVK